MSSFGTFGLSLPNLHPAMVHFPLALLTAALVFDLLSLMARRSRWIDMSAATLYLLGTLGGIAAYRTGRAAEDSLTQVPASAQALLAEHADWAWRTLLIFIAVAVGRLGLAWLDRQRSEIRYLALRVLVLLVAAGGGWSLFQTADRGGAMVYLHGVAVARQTGPSTSPPPSGSGSGPAPEASPDPQPELSDSPQARLFRGENGSLSWVPMPGDAQALGSILTLAPGSDPQAVVLAPDWTAQTGLRLKVAGRSVLLLPGVYDDVQVEAHVDISGFSGTAGVAHHVREADSTGAFQISSQGRAALVHMIGGATHALSEAPVSIPTAPPTFTVSVAGTHLKGMVNGKVVAHGHGDPGEAGGAGLVLDGTGTIRIISMKIEPLKPY